MVADNVQTHSRQAKELYYLSNHTFACLGDHHCVFLDLRRDAYLTVGRDEMEALGPWIVGWTATGEPVHSESTTMPDQPLQTAEQLVKRGVLTTVQTQGKELAAPRVSMATAEFERRSRPPSFKPHHAYNFVKASIDAFASLRWKPLERTVGEVRQRKARRENARSRASDDTNLVEIFDHLRPYFPRDYLCLFDSLALVNFLARYGRFPQWVFGVRSDPFSAHCWVQQDSCVLNDSMEHVQTYVPIMSV
jgi:hypothetical protein